MARSRAKVFDYEVEVARDGSAALPDGAVLALGEEWTPEHLLLAALVRCSIKSLRYHAKRAGHEVRASGTAAGRVTRREQDGRYALVSIECRIDAAFDPPTNEPGDLLAKAERDCFIGASLALAPRYEWRVS